MDVTGADVVAFRKNHEPPLSRAKFVELVGPPLTPGGLWRIENKNVITIAECHALTAAGVTTSSDLDVDPSPELEPEIRPSDGAQTTRLVANSELQTFKRCRRKWWLGWYRGLRLRRESPVGPRAVGERIHQALKTHYSPNGPLDLLGTLEGLIIIDRSRLGDVEPEVTRRFEEDADLERIMMEGYLEWLAETGADADLRVVAPETRVDVEFDVINSRLVSLIGKIDVRVEYERDGTRLFIEHKTLDAFGRLVPLLPIFEQTMHYQLLERLDLAPTGDVRTAGALVNMLRRVKRSPRARPPFYQRVEVYHNAHTMESYRRRLTGEVRDMLTLEDHLDVGVDPREVAYPTPTHNCVWDCQFFQVCSMFDDGSRVEAALEAHYAAGDTLAYYDDMIQPKEESEG